MEVALIILFGVSCLSYGLNITNRPECIEHRTICVLCMQSFLFPRKLSLVRPNDCLLPLRVIINLTTSLGYFLSADGALFIRLSIIW